MLRRHHDRVADGLDVHFQPLVDLDRGTVVAVEALVRGPVGSELAAPMPLFTAAAQEGRLEELDWTCRALALRAARGRLPHGVGLFINVEPSAADADVPLHLDELVEADGLPPVTVELTERALTDDPARLLAAVAALRARGWRIALDDVGAVPESVTLMPFVAPDVVKLDLALVQVLPDEAAAATLHAVQSYAEESGAVVVAEGIETVEQQAYARALGARYGQGFLFERPGPLADVLHRPFAVAPRLATAVRPPRDGDERPATPFEAVARRVGARPADRALLTAMRERLEAQAALLTMRPVVLSTLAPWQGLDDGVARRLADLAECCAMVGIVGPGLDGEPVPGSAVRGGPVAPDDPSTREGAFVVVGPHFAAALVARADGPGDAPTRAALTFERHLVLRAARELMGRLCPSPSEPEVPAPRPGAGRQPVVGSPLLRQRSRT